MHTLSLANLKGGVGKSFMVKHIAHILATNGFKVLVIDNDKQGNTSRFFQANQDITLADLLVGLGSADEVIQRTQYDNLDIISANMTLMDANIEVLNDQNRDQVTILQDAIASVWDRYHFCIIDNPPDINLSIFNAMVMTDQLIIVTTPDKDAMDGVDEMMQQIARIKQFNLDLKIHCLMNRFVSSSACYNYKDSEKYPFFSANIHLASKETYARLVYSTEKHIPITELSPHCVVSRDLKKFVHELLSH